MLNTTFKTKICVGLGKRTIPYLKEREAFKQRPRSMHARVVVDHRLSTQLQRSTKLKIWH